MNIALYPNDLLQVTCTELDIDNLSFDPKTRKEDMLTIVKEQQKRGIAITGLSANQIGYTERFMLIENRLTNQNYDRQQMCINPRIVEQEEEEVEMFESSASFPNVIVSISRPAKIRVEFYNEFLKRRNEWFDGYTARFFQHYLDLLNGVTFNEHVAPSKWKEALAKAEKKNNA